MSPLYIQLFLTASALALYIVIRRWYRSSTSGLKSVPRAAGGHWLWGHEKDAWETPDAGFYIKNFDKCGQAFAMRGGLFSDDILAINDPAALSHMFTKHPYNYPKSVSIRPLVERIMGRSLLWAEGDEHKRQRAALAPVFTHSMVKQMEFNVRDTSERFVDMLKEHISDDEPTNKGTGGDAVEINVVDWTSRATLQIIGSIGLGHDFRLGETDDAKAITQSLHEIATINMTPAGFIAPLVLRTFPFITNLPIKAIQAQGTIKLVTQRLGKEIVEENRRANCGEIKGKDLLSTLLRLEDARGEQLDRMLDHIATFIVAGHETTSTALNLTLYSLARNKPAQDRLRHELLSFPSAEPTYDDYLNKLPFLDAVTKEAMRFHPAVMYTERVAVKDDILPLLNPIRNPRTGEEVRSVMVKKGQTIHISHMAINRSKAMWGEDASEFKPERWISTVPASGKGGPVVGGAIHSLVGPTQGWNGIFTFIEGPRICIGVRLGECIFAIYLACDNKILISLHSHIRIQSHPCRPNQEL
ncbi:hypothetical protein FRB93_005106 [Tulasnella sp. JGI-2019a]|nr:hypothetical protein FRB93_005106 [Tulasnella sp. JGI-2019a]